MNDEFLTQFYEAPRAEFAEVLYQRISRQRQSYFARMMGQRLTLRNAIIVFVVVFLAAACVYAVTDRGWRKVGGIWVDVERTHIYELYRPPQTEESLEKPKCLTVEEAKKILRFEIHVPAWAPEGFTFSRSICGVNQLSDFAVLYWQGKDESSGINITATNLRMFNMAAQKYEVQMPSLWQPVAPGSYKEVQVHGRPAVLVRGDWDVPETIPDPGQTLELEVKWNKKLGSQLVWVEGETMYSLYTRTEVSAEDLIKMAESTQ